MDCGAFNSTLGFEGKAGKQKALWIYGKPLLCILGRLKIHFCEDTTVVPAGGIQVGNAMGETK